MDAIRTFDLTKTYDGMPVVNRCSLRIERGEIYGFIGRNGAGKSTIMKMICGLVTPTSGRVELYDDAGRGLSNTAGQIGALIEAPGLLPDFDARHNLEIKARALGLPPDPATIDWLLGAVQLSTATQTVRGYSMGMRQRLGIALAMLGAPPILLLDEPLNGLDPQGIRDMRTLLRQLRDERGVTIFISSHILGELEKVATRFGVINEGTLVAELTAEDVHRMSAESLMVGTATPADTAELLARALPECTVTLGEDDLITVSGPFERERVARLLYEAGAMVTELTVRRQDPEEYFLKLMERPTLTVGGDGYPGSAGGNPYGGGLETPDGVPAGAEAAFAPPGAPGAPGAAPQGSPVVPYDPYASYKEGRRSQ